MYNYAEFLQTLKNNPVIPVVVIENELDAVSLARTLKDNGCNIIEITLRTKAALPALRLIKAAKIEIIIGIGTVTSADEFRQAVDAGAAFIVSPGSSEELLEYGAAQTVPYLPGVMTSSEILQARAYGYCLQKFFPATLAGGIGGLKTYGSVYSDVLFCPTGGITGENYRDFLALKNVVALGGTWIAKPEDVANGSWEAIAKRVQDCYGN